MSRILGIAFDGRLMAADKAVRIRSQLPGLLDAAAEDRLRLHDLDERIFRWCLCQSRAPFGLTKL